jgi:hypothetical protein
MVIFQKIIKNEDLRRNYAAGVPVLYVFGDNVVRKGMGGQAGEMRHEPNAVGVATKYRPTMDGDAFFSEQPAAVEAQKRILDTDMKPLFEHLKKGGLVVFPADGIGTGLSRMPELAPTTFAYLEEKLAALVKVGRLWNTNREGAITLANRHLA